jgi:hypothetical protein
MVLFLLFSLGIVFQLLLREIEPISLQTIIYGLKAILIQMHEDKTMNELVRTKKK